MAQKINPAPSKPLFTLNEEGRAEIDRISKDLDRASDFVKDIAELGIDGSRLQSVIDRGRKTRDIILKYLDDKGNVD